MSTRSQILFADQTCKVYKHSDGYPSGVLPILMPFVKYFMKHRGWDVIYMVARLVCTIAASEKKHRTAMIKNMKASGVDPSYISKNKQGALIGLGVDTGWHGDIAYAYVIRTNAPGLDRKPGNVTIDVYQTYPSSQKGEVYLNSEGLEINRDEVMHTGAEDLDTVSATKLGSFPCTMSFNKALEALKKDEE